MNFLRGKESRPASLEKRTNWDKMKKRNLKMYFPANAYKQPIESSLVYASHMINLIAFGLKQRKPQYKAFSRC